MGLEDLRAGDADRERVVELLRRAQAEGRIDIHEYDERLGAAWAARTYRDLELVTADLPATAEAAHPPASRTVDGRGHRAAPPRGVVAAWASASVINVVIWGLASVASASWVHPWWIWVAGPWGAVLLAGWIAARVVGGPVRPPTMCAGRRAFPRLPHVRRRTQASYTGVSRAP
ncbi:MAG: DUF1707 SHOCT-like domain-containing protein [Pseudonocardia sp.]